jgi:hypothetical protein
MPAAESKSMSGRWTCLDASKPSKQNHDFIRPMNPSPLICFSFLDAKADAKEQIT